MKSGPQKAKAKSVKPKAKLVKPKAKSVKAKAKSAAAPVAEGEASDAGDGSQSDEETSPKKRPAALRRPAAADKGSDAAAMEKKPLGAWQSHIKVVFLLKAIRFPQHYVSGKLSAPYWYKNANAWGVKMDNKQIFSVTQLHQIFVSQHGVSLVSQPAL